MKFLLTILTFFTLSASAQEPFVLGKSYPTGVIVWYPQNVFWKAKKAVKAKTYPSDNSTWTRFTYPAPDNGKGDSKPDVVPIQLDPAAVTRATIDSLTKRFAVIEGLQKTIDSLRKANSNYFLLFDTVYNRLRAVEMSSTSIANRLYSVEKLPARLTTIERDTAVIDSLQKDVITLKNPELSTVKISQWGFPIITMSKDGTFSVRSIVLGEGLTGKIADSTLFIDTRKK